MLKKCPLDNLGLEVFSESESETDEVTIATGEPSEDRMLPDKTGEVKATSNGRSRSRTPSARDAGAVKADEQAMKKQARFSQWAAEKAAVREQKKLAKSSTS